MNSNEFVPYEEAIALKELGFIGDCLAYYTPIIGGIRMEYFHQKGHNVWSYFDKPNGSISFFADSNPFTVEDYQKKLDEIAIAPLYQQAFRWFRENFKLDSHVKVASVLPNGEFSQYSYCYNQVELRHEHFLDSYEEAKLACLRKLIEIVKNKKQ